MSLLELIATPLTQVICRKHRDWSHLLASCTPNVMLRQEVHSEIGASSWYLRFGMWVLI